MNRDVAKIRKKETLKYYFSSLNVNEKFIKDDCFIFITIFLGDHFEVMTFDKTHAEKSFQVGNLLIEVVVDALNCFCFFIIR